MADYNQLVKEYRRLAKQADQRLVRLEAYKHDRGFETATKWAYARAQKDINQWNYQRAVEVSRQKYPDISDQERAKKINDIMANAGHRFNTAPPSNTTQLQAKINDIKTFLEKPTSTKRGIINSYKKRADTINKKYGTDFTWQDLAEYYLSGTADKLDSKFGSKTALKTIAAIQKLDKKKIDEIKKSKDKIKVVDDDVLNININQLLKENNIDKSMMY